MGFRLTPRSMTLDTLNCCKVEFSRNFAWFRVFGRLQWNIVVRQMALQRFSETVLCNAVARLLSVSYGLSCFFYFTPAFILFYLPCADGFTWVTMA